MIRLFTALAAVFIASLFLGRMATRVRVPKVTGYLLAGILAGPAVQELLGTPPLLTWDLLENFRVFMELALALIVFNIGLECRAERFQRWGRRLLVLSATEIVATFLLVAVLTGLVDFFLIRAVARTQAYAATASLHMALFLGVIAIATAPAATLFVIREYEAEGPMTEILLILIGLNNMAAIVGFILLSSFMLHGSLPLAVFNDILLPFLLGGAAGFIMGIWGQRLERPREFQLLALGFVALVIGACYALRLNLMLAVFALGVMFVNAAPKSESLQKALRQIDFPLYVIFFVLSGAAMHLETLTRVGLLGLAYVAARIAGKLLGGRLGTRWGGFGEDEQKYLGFTLLAQAGVAIGLAQTLARTWHAGGQTVETVILGSLIVFEMAGPLSVRHGLVRAGEVSLLSYLVRKAPQTAFEGFHQVVEHFRDALGVPAHKRLKNSADILVKHVMRKNVETVRSDLHFNEFLKIVAYSRYDRFPVVDRQGRFIGVVDYQDIRDMIFEPVLGNLIIVGDLVKSRPLVAHGEQKVREVLRIFRRHPDITYLPVVDADDPGRLLGMLNQNTVLSLFRPLS